MNTLSIRALLSEIAVLFAILAMVAGPIALAKGRTGAIPDQIAVAMGLKAMPLCTPGESAKDSTSHGNGQSCDHCLPACFGSAKARVVLDAVAFIYAPVIYDLPAVHLHHARTTGLPPSTGPPAV